MRVSSIVVGIALAAPLATPAWPQGAQVSSSIEAAHKAEKLKPGQWMWAPKIAPEGPILIYIDLTGQLATVYRNGVRIGVATVSSGKRGYETPTGVFTILQKDIDHRSNRYSNAPMPYMLRLTWDGIALHAGVVPGHPQSHGCVRLPMGFAKQLYAAASLGMTVVVADGAPGELAAVAAAPTPPAGQAAAQVADPAADYSWNPDASPAGPVTIVMSKADQVVVVLRNGVEIGRAKAFVPLNGRTQVLTLTSPRNGSQDWIPVEVPGPASQPRKPADPSIVDDVRMPPAFQAKVRAILAPGATVLATMAPISSTTTGEKLALLDAPSAEKKP